MQRGVASGAQLDDCYSAHAEENAILKGAQRGVRLEGTMMYATNKPCKTCMNQIVNAGIKKVIYLENYNSQITSTIAKESGVELVPYKHGVTPRAFPRVFDKLF